MSSSFWDSLRPPPPDPSRAPLKVSVRTFGTALEEALMSYTRVKLETILEDELALEWQLDYPPGEAHTKRDLIQGYTSGWKVAQLAGLARRVVTELDVQESYLVDLKELLATFDAGGGVEGPTKNLIFAANGPKPEIRLRDAMNNDIEIVKNAEFCLVYDQPLPAEGLQFSRLVSWWRDVQGIAADVGDRDVALSLHDRLRASLDSDVERVLFDAYQGRYRESFDIPALVPQVYLHYDPYDRRTRRSSGVAPLSRQRMDFLLLFTDRRRVVIEVDGKQHYAEGDVASPRLYAEMVSEDRRLRLAGYEVYRFGGWELTSSGATTRVQEFFDDLATRMR